MASTQDLYDVYVSFCSFGSNRNLATGSSSSLTGDVTMEGSKFSKLCKDCKVIDNKKVTSTDVDILFNKVKSKGSRRIDWDEFQEAFQYLAEQRFPSKTARDAYQSLLHIVSDKGPVARATITKTGGVYDKLTDTKLYTGSHKSRFDENGIGKGAGKMSRVTPNQGGRDYGQATLSHSQVVNRDKNHAVSHNTHSSKTNISGPSNSTSVGAGKKRGIVPNFTYKGQTSVVTASVESLEVRSKPGKKIDSHLSNTTLNKKSTSKSTGSLNKSNASINKSSTNVARPGTSGNYTAKKSGTSVFDRLTDSNGYTGSHAHRFNADGSGRGLSGRDTVRKGNGSTSQDGLARILRT